MPTVDVLPLAELPEGEVRAVSVEGYAPIAVYNLGGEVFATDDLCTHGNARNG